MYYAIITAILYIVQRVENVTWLIDEFKWHFSMRVLRDSVRCV